MTDFDLDDYLRAHTSPQGAALDELERQTNLRLVNGRMCSGHVQGRLLKMLVAMARPKRILELGTFSGFSALSLAEGLPPEGKLVTIEADDELEDMIRQALATHPAGERVELLIGDALDLMRQRPDGEFDMIFIDADKRQYPQYYAEAKRLTSPGGFIVADNTLWDGHVADPRRHDPQTVGIREFNRLAVEDHGVEAVMVPLRDGLTIIRRL